MIVAEPKKHQKLSINAESVAPKFVTLGVLINVLAYKIGGTLLVKR